MNDHTGTPVNAVLFDGLFTILLGLLVFAGPQAINAVFALSIVGLYFAYVIPIAARFVGDNKDLKPGPFSLGMMVSGQCRCLFFFFFFRAKKKRGSGCELKYLLFFSLSFRVFQLRS